MLSASLIQLEYASKQWKSTFSYWSEAVANGNLLALLHWDAADECQWGALVPHLTGRHTYMATPPRGHPRPAGNDLIAAFRDHGILPDDTWREVRQKTLGRDYRRRVRAPLRQRWDDLWLRRLGRWSPPSHLPHTCHLCGECDTVSFAAPTDANRCAQCSQVAACPWPEPPAGPHRRTEEEALHRCIGGAHVPSHERAGPAGAALLWIHVHLRDPTSVALCRARSTMPLRRGGRPEHARARRGAQEAANWGLVADAVTEGHEAHAAAQHDPAGSARAFLREAALPASRALNGAGAPTLLPAMHRIGNAVRPGLISRRQPSKGTGWSGARPTGQAGPCPWGRPCS